MHVAHALRSVTVAAALTVCPLTNTAVHAAPEAAAAATSSAAPFVLLDRAALEQVKARLASGDPVVAKAVERLRKDADAALAKPAPSVTEKKTLPVGDDPHNYMSLAIYFWPDPNTPDGKPYVNRDGVVNREEVNQYDAPRKERLINGVRAMALAYYLLDDPKYADGAAKYLRTWFLDSATRMNPNLNHAQFVPGRNDGRCYGIIETRAFVQLCDAVNLLEGSAAWSEADRNGFRAWMSEFVDWLQTSKNGKEEANTQNNHGQWYDAQLAGIARYLGRDDIVRRVAEENGKRRLAEQVEPDGSLPKELSRTRSLHYSLFAIDAWVQLASIAKPVGVDLFQFKTDDDRSLKQAIDYLTPYLLGEKKWERPTLEGDRYNDYAGMFRHLARAYDDERLTAVAKTLTPADDEVSVFDLLTQ